MTLFLGDGPIRAIFPLQAVNGYLLGICGEDGSVAVYQFGENLEMAIREVKAFRHKGSKWRARSPIGEIKDPKEEKVRFIHIYNTYISL